MGSKRLATVQRVEITSIRRVYTDFHVTIILENVLKECIPLIPFPEFTEHHASSDYFEITDRCIFRLLAS